MEVVTTDCDVVNGRVEVVFLVVVDEVVAGTDASLYSSITLFPPQNVAESGHN